MEWVGAPFKEKRLALRVCSVSRSLVMFGIKIKWGFPSFSRLGEGAAWPGPFSTWMHSPRCSGFYNVMMFGARLLPGNAGIRAAVAQRLL